MTQAENTKTLFPLSIPASLMQELKILAHNEKKIVTDLIITALINQYPSLTGGERKPISRDTVINGKKIKTSFFIDSNLKNNLKVLSIVEILSMTYLIELALINEYKLKICN